MSWSYLWSRRTSGFAGKLPKESYVGLHFETDGSPDLWIVNRALIPFEAKPTFPWHLSIIINMKDVIEMGLPTREEQHVLGELGEEMGGKLKANGNALILASGTWKGVRQLLFRVRDPEVANRYLSVVVANPSAVRPMEYRMEQDPLWAKAEQYLAAARRAEK